jgi:hypothetical protein
MAGGKPPFPWLQIITLCTCSFATCINQTVLYPIRRAPGGAESRA